jgi:hypothetical protein
MADDLITPWDFGTRVRALLAENADASNPDWNVACVLRDELGDDDALELLVAMIRVMLAKGE